MEVQVAETGPCSRTLTITIPPERVQEHVAEFYKNAAQQVQLKGFRPGKVPRKVLEKRFGDSILAEAKENLVSRSFEDAVRSQELAFVGRPRVDGVDAEPINEKEAFEFQVHVDLQPQFELGEVKGLEAEKPETDVTDDDVQRALDDIAERKKSLSTVDEAVGTGDFVKVDLLFHNEGGDEVHKREGVQINAGIPVAGTDPATFAEKLIGAEKGAGIELELTFPDTFEKEEVRGQKGKVTIQVHEVLRVVPAPIDDEMAKSFEFDDLDALKADLRGRIGDEKERLGNSSIEESLIQKLMDAHPFDLPQSLVDEQKEHSINAFRERLKQAGISDEEIETKVTEAQEEAGKDAERKVRAFFLLDAIARREQIQVTEADLTAELHNIAAANNAPIEQVHEYFRQEGRIHDLQVGVMERKVRDFLRENATITDK